MHASIRDQNCRGRCATAWICNSDLDEFKCEWFCTALCRHRDLLPSTESKLARGRIHLQHTPSACLYAVLAHEWGFCHVVVCPEWMTDWLATQKKSYHIEIIAGAKTRLFPVTRNLTLGAIGCLYFTSWHHPSHALYDDAERHRLPTGSLPAF